jgi:hypothetical protein
MKEFTQHASAPDSGQKAALPGEKRR